MANNQVDQSFYESVLTGIGAPVTPHNIAFLEAWHPFELSSAAFNPFNTTQPMPGSTGIGAQSPNDVQSYANPQQGIDATIKTLLNGNYPELVAQLRTGDPRPTLGLKANLSTWGSGSFAAALGAGSATPVTFGGTNTGGGHSAVTPIGPAQPSTVSFGQGVAHVAGTIGIYIAAAAFAIIGLVLIFRPDVAKMAKMTAA